MNFIKIPTAGWNIIRIEDNEKMRAFVWVQTGGKKEYSQKFKILNWVALLFDAGGHV